MVRARVNKQARKPKLTERALNIQRKAPIIPSRKEHLPSKSLRLNYLFGYDTQAVELPISQRNFVHGFDVGENCCYINATLQCLLGCQVFANYLISTYKGEASATFCFLEYLRETAYLLFVERREIQPRFIADNLKDLDASLKYGAMQDAEHFLRSLILKLAEINANELNICMRSMSGLIHNNAISHIFQPTIRTRIWCLCGHSHEEAIHPITISLPIHETIEKSMENITAPTTLPGHICPACGKSGGVQKSDHFQRAPIVLLLCLERSSFSPVGVVPIYTKIRYGMTLNLSPYFCGPPSDLIYQLQATTFYTGHANIRNHFTAQVLSADGIWRYCNDSNIQRLIEPKLYSRDAYLLFYSLKSPSSF